jgi:hypothetical protein
MEVSGQFQSLVALPPGKWPRVTIESEALWAASSVWARTNISTCADREHELGLSFLSYPILLLLLQIYLVPLHTVCS